MRSTFAHLTRSKKTLGVTVGAVVAAVAVSGAGYASMTKSVDLSIDGQNHEVRVLGSTVRDVLESKGVTVGQRDVVVPSLDSKVTDGTAIAVKFARPLDVSVDGEDRRYWVTATDVSSALDQIGLGLHNADLSVSRGAASLMPVAIGSARPCRELNPYVSTYPGSRDEQPIPDTTTVSCGSSRSSDSVRYTEFSTAKSPQPGHHTGLRSLLYSSGVYLNSHSLTTPPPRGRRRTPVATRPAGRSPTR